jgi:predicted DNA binding CopG/RHH family protein
MPIAKINQIVLDEYEKEIEQNIDKTSSYSPRIKKQKIAMLQKAAKHHLKVKENKDKRITIRVYSKDILKIKELAEDEGLPYQTYLTSILHKLAMGKLIVKAA